MASTIGGLVYVAVVPAYRLPDDQVKVILGETESRINGEEAYVREGGREDEGAVRDSVG